MKSLSFVFLAVTCAAWAQTTPPPSPASPAETGDTVIAIFEDGVKMTLDDYKALVPVLPQAYQQLASRDRNQFLHYYAMMRKAAQMAEQEKLDQRSPYKELLAYARLSTLTDIKLAAVRSAVTVDPAEIEKYYNEHKDPYKQIKVSGIYIAFSNTPEAPPASSPASTMASVVPQKKTLTETAAKAKAEKLLADIRGGADFAKLVQTESDDETSKAKGGDFGMWRVTDNVPDLMRQNVFNLKQGEVTEPVRQANGFYLFRADEVKYTPLAEVRDSIFDQLKQQKAQEWIRKFDAETRVEIPGKETPAPLSPGK